MMLTPLDSQVTLHKALGHPARLRVLGMLARGELCVCQITAVLALAYSTVSSHLAELRRAGLITERKEGRWVYYRLAEDETAAAVARDALAAIADDPTVAGDRELLARACCVPPEALCKADLDLARITVTTPEGSRTEP